MRKHFDQSGVDKDNEVCIISTLLYHLGEEADDVLSSTNISSGDWEKYDSFLGKLQVRKNITYERANYNKQDQLDRETDEEYITVLYSLVKTCKYKEL